MCDSYIHIYILMTSFAGYFVPLHFGRLARMSVLDTEVDSSNPGSSMLFP